jgi:hypothetical protein
MRYVCCVAVAVLTAACSNEPAPASAPAPAARTAPVDPQHQGLTEPHGDHTPHRGGMVLMNADVHYEVVLSRDGRHRIWFTDAVRAELPASVASGVTLTITRPGESPEVLALAIDDNGESWVASGRPVTGDDAYVKVSYSLQGEPHEVELPFVPGTPPPTP